MPEKGGQWSLPGRGCALARTARETAKPIMTTQRGRKPPPTPSGGVRKFPEAGPFRRAVTDGWEFDEMSWEEKDLSAQEGRGGQRTLHLTPWSPLAWQVPRARLTAPARETGQGRTRPGGIACELGWGAPARPPSELQVSHSPAGSEEGLPPSRLWPPCCPDTAPPPRSRPSLSWAGSPP